ncbi:MAG: hypothetical protein WCO50_07080, partial [Synechococcus sp. ELA619]
STNRHDYPTSNAPNQCTISTRIFHYAEHASRLTEGRKASHSKAKSIVTDHESSALKWLNNRTSLQQTSSPNLKEQGIGPYP